MSNSGTEPELGGEGIYREREAEVEGRCWPPWLSAPGVAPAAAPAQTSGARPNLSSPSQGPPSLGQNKVSFIAFSF